MGYTVETKWECDLQKDLKNNPEMKLFFAKTEIIEQIFPRDSLYGGRTEAIKLYHKCVGSEKIFYVDIVSLYPWVCKYGSFPLGHPQVITENFEDINKKTYYGLIKCDILPPPQLFHPILPIKYNERLIFTLCKQCTIENSTSCSHNEQERILTGTWNTDELYKSLEKGYKVKKIHEIWNYKQRTQYDKKAGTKGIFSCYIDKFLKIKQQAEGWPMWVKNENDKNKYIKDYQDHEGILLDKDKIEKNPGLRALAKLCLNSFWGKFAQRNNLTKTKYVTTCEELLKMFNDDTLEISTIHFHNENLVSLNYKVNNNLVQPQTSTNPVLASFVTSQARLRLLEFLETLNEKVLYYDTDSVIYLSKNGEKLIPTNDYLGSMSNELKNFGENAHISEFLAGGPKNYGFIVANGENVVAEILKIRGIRLTYENNRTLNFQELKKMIFLFISKNPIVRSIYESTISRDVNRNVFSFICKKDYRIVFEKRFLDEFSSLPYGFKSE